MLRGKPFKRVFAVICCIAIVASMSVPVSAAEGTIDITYAKITADGFVADTMNGVESRYNLSGPTLYCTELITRYYRQVYGLDININSGKPSVPGNDDLYFEETPTPKQGDIMFGSAAARGKGYNHWSLVKSFDGVSVTCFEQNWRWNGQAGVNRRIAYPTSYYKIYTLKSKSGNLPKGTGIEEPPAASEWAVSYLDRAAEAGIAELSTDYQKQVSREEFCRMAVNVAANYGISVTGDTARLQALALGLVSETQSETLTREDAAVITVRLLDRIGKAPAADPQALTAYTDVATIAPWATNAVSQLTACGLMSGSAGAFQPKAPLTNEQAIALMVRVSENPTPAVTYTAQASSSPEGSNLAAIEIVKLGAENMLLSRK